MKQRYVSYAKESIEGEIGDFMGGFNKRPAEPIPDRPPGPPPTPLYARCVVLWDDEYANIVVSVDVLGIPKQLRTNCSQCTLASYLETRLGVVMNRCTDSPRPPYH